MAEPTDPGEGLSTPAYAALWKRLAAFLVDLTLFGMLGGISRVLFPQVTGSGYLALAGWIYFAAMESSGLQATVGKKLLGLRVTGRQGNRLGFWRASARYGGKLLSVISLGAGFAMIFFTEEKQTFHDYVAGSVVLDERATPLKSSPNTPTEPL